MKIRTDFVSNSSSTSFIVEVDDVCKSNISYLAVGEIVSALSRNYSYGDCTYKTFTKDLIVKLIEANVVDKRDYNLTDEDGFDFIYDLKIKTLLKPENKELLTDLLKEAVAFDVQHGDDCDEQYEFYGYASWLMSKNFKLHDSDSSSLSIFDHKRYDEQYENIMNSL